MTKCKCGQQWSKTNYN